MGLETGNFISDLNDNWPVEEDGLNQSDDHHKLTKKTIKNTFPGSGGQGFNRAIVATEDELDTTVGVTSSIQAQLDALSALVAANTLGNTPVGGVIDYNGLIANIPNNWQLCDGTNGTQNLVDQFVFGTVTEAEIGDSGGSADAVLVSHTHTANHAHSASSDQIPPHDHDTDSSLNNTAGTTKFLLAQDGGSAPKKTELAGAFTPTITVNNQNVTTSNAGGSATNANLPPYVKLAKIQRMS